MRILELCKIVQLIKLPLKSNFAVIRKERRMNSDSAVSEFTRAIN